MGKYVIRNAKILLNGYDLSSDHNQIGLTVTREEKECTTFGKAGVQRLAGLQSFDVSGSGFFEAASADYAVTLTLGTANSELTILPQGTSVGSKGFISEVTTFEYAPGGSVGDVLGFTFAGKGEGTVLVEGTVLKSGVVSGTSTSTAVNLGQIAAGRMGYATLHVTVAGDTTLNVTIQSDNTSGFSTPTTRVSFTQVGTGIASEWKSTTATGSTDFWWRAKCTPGGASTAYTAHVTFGISYL